MTPPTARPGPGVAARWALTAAALALAGCSGTVGTEGGDGDVSSTTEAVEPISVATDGSVELAWEALTEAAYWALEAGDDGEFWYLHTNEPDGLFSIEAYTSGFGTGWSGELGTYPVGCSRAGTGICLHMVVPGAEPNLPSDFAASGLVTFVRLDAEGYELVLQDIVFGNGLAIPGPVRLAG